MPRAKYFLKIKNASPNILTILFVCEVFSKNVIFDVILSTGEYWLFSFYSRSFGYGFETVVIRFNAHLL
jgi:hypothetical protein